MNGFDKGFCNECHTNVHKNQFSTRFAEQSCKTCHTVDNFTKRLPFNHNLTRFQLNGAHKNRKCEACHLPTEKLFEIKEKRFMSQFVFPKLATEKCLSCHQDVHAGQLGNQCLKCHTESKWVPAKFNHQTMSKYPLNGKHFKLDCKECHKPTGKLVQEYQKKISVVHHKPIGMQCISCHQDPHKGHFGKSCVSCHNETDWKTQQAFHQNFTLSGVHFVAQCTECHSQARKLSGLSEQCIACHRKDDIHSGNLPNCGDCHRQDFWENSKFNHSLSSFPLRGAHRTIQCQECHSKGIYQGLAAECVSCHLLDAQKATSFNHNNLTNLNSCTECHRNQFSFKNR